MMNKLKRILRELSQFNRVEKSYLLAQFFSIIGLAILLTLLPIVVNAVTGKAAMIGMVMAISTWALMIPTFFSGNIVALLSMRKVLIQQSFAQMAFFLIIALLLFIKQLTIPLLIIILIASGLVSTLSNLLNIDRGGSSRIFSTPAKKETALYLYNLSFYLSMIIVPITLGLLIDLVRKYIGIEFALALSYLIFCSFMLASAILYIKDLYPLTDITIDTNNKQFITKKNILLKTHKNMWNAIKIVWHNPALRLCFMLYNIDTFIYTPLTIVVLPTLAINILHRGATGSGLLLGATNAGAVLAILFLLGGKQSQKKYGLYRYIFWLTILASCAFIPSILFWKYPILWIAAFAALCIKIFLEPQKSRLELLVQLEINGDENAKTEESNVFAILQLSSSFILSLGCFVFGWIFIHSSSGTWLYNSLGPSAPLKILTLLLLIYGVINILAIIFLKHYIYRVYPLGYISEEETMQQLKESLQHQQLNQPIIEIFRKPFPATQPTIALLASATDDHLAQAQASVFYYNRDIHLVLDSAWILEVLQEDGTNRLYLKKGIYFDREGDPILAEYKTPKLIHYYANFYNPSDPLNISTVNLENRLDTPMSASSRLQRLINDNLLMHIWLSSKDILAPITCAFLMPEHHLMNKTSNKNDSESLSTFIIAFPTDEKNPRTIIREHILTLLSLYQGRELVVKPSGSGIIPPEGVKYFNSNDAIDDIVEHIIILSKHRLMTATSAIIIEEYFHPPALFLRYNKNDGSGRYCILDKPTPLHILSLDEIATADNTIKKEWVVHVLAARTPWGKCLTTGFIARADDYGRPLTKTAAIIPFENIITALRIQHGLLKTDDEVWALEKEIDDLATQVLSVIDEEQKKYPPMANAPLQDQIDYFGLDLIFTLIGGILKPRIIAFHDHTVGRQYQFDKVYPELVGEHSKIWFSTMYSRARKDACKGKRLILIGAGHETRRPFFECAKTLGIELILLDKSSSWARDLVSEFLIMTGDNLENIRQQALLTISNYIHSFGAVDGISTYCTKHAILTIELARDLDLPHLSMSTVRTTTNKLKIQTSLSAAGLAVPLSFQVIDENSLEIALHQINRIEHITGLSRFPMIIKPLFKSKEILLTKCYNPEEIRLFFKNLTVNEIDNNAFMIEEFITGKEFFIDIAIQNSKINYVAITDNESRLIGETLFPNCYSLPCTQFQAQEQRACINLAKLSLQALEITDGIIHIKGIYESNTKGAYILEIDPLPADHYLSLWHQDVWGIDIPELFFAIVLQIPLNAQASDTPLTYLEAYDFTTTQEGIFQGWEGIEQLTQSPGFKTFHPLVKAGDRITITEDQCCLLGYLIVEGQTKAEALAHFENCISKIHYTIKDV
jgi:biotin carboxylase